jgi:hypothetical protein
MASAIELIVDFYVQLDHTAIAYRQTLSTLCLGQLRRLGSLDTDGGACLRLRIAKVTFSTLPLIQ